MAQSDLNNTDHHSNSTKIKGSWSPIEDATLLKMVEQHGPRNWSLISSRIPGRSGKSCRLRWCNQLSPDVEHRPFTPEEDDVIVRAHALHGNKWSTISRLLRGRTDNAIKNHWNSTLRRRGVTGDVRVLKREITDGSYGLKREMIEQDVSVTVQETKRRCCRNSAGDGGCDGDGDGDGDGGGCGGRGPATVLTLLPPGEVTEGVEDDGGDDVEEKSTVEIESTDLVSMMKRMIAEEVRKYMNELRGKEGRPGFDTGPGFQPWAQAQKCEQSLARQN